MGILDRLFSRNRPPKEQKSLPPDRRLPPKRTEANRKSSPRDRGIPSEPTETNQTVSAEELTGTGSFDVAAVGESNYQAELRSGIGGGRSGSVQVHVTAVLVREPENPYDSDAVAVYITGGGKVGYLSRDDARRYSRPLEKLAREGDVGSCKALISGAGTYEGRRGMLGIWLDLAAPEKVLLPPEETNPTGGGRSTGASGTARSSAGDYLGKHYTEYVERVRELKRQGALNDAALVLRGLIDAVEAEAAVEGQGVAPWYYEQLAIVLRKQKDFEGEVETLERYAGLVQASGASTDKLLERLPKARAKLEKSRGT